MTKESGTVNDRTERYWVRVFWDDDVAAYDVSFMEGDRCKERHFVKDLSELIRLGVSTARWCKYGTIRSKE